MQVLSWPWFQLRTPVLQGRSAYRCALRCCPPDTTKVEDAQLSLYAVVLIVLLTGNTSTHSFKVGSHTFGHIVYFSALISGCVWLLCESCIVWYSSTLGSWNFHPSHITWCAARVYVLLYCRPNPNTAKKAALHWAKIFVFALIWLTGL